MAHLWRRISSLSAAITFAAGLSACSERACPTLGAPVQATHVVQPGFPTLAMQQGEEGTTLVDVTIDGSGHVVSTTISKSSGSESLDTAAIDGAKASTYAAGIDGCQTFGGSLGYQAVFEGVGRTTATATIVPLSQ